MLRSGERSEAGEGGGTTYGDRKREAGKRGEESRGRSQGDRGREEGTEDGELVRRAAGDGAIAPSGSERLEWGREGWVRSPIRTLFPLQ